MKASLTLKLCDYGWYVSLHGAAMTVQGRIYYGLKKDLVTALAATGFDIENEDIKVSENKNIIKFPVYSA